MNRTLLITIITTAFFLILSPILIFIFQFNNSELSVDITDWGSFGDYFGGIISPIFSIFSFIILVYITFLINRLSSDDSKYLFILQKRIDAYEELSKYIPRLNISILELKEILSDIDHELKNGLIPFSEDYKTKLLLLKERGKVVTELHFFLFAFNIRYSHLFKFDFDSDIYKKLIDSSDLLRLDIDSLINGLMLRAETKKLELPKKANVFVENLVDFVNELTKELE